MSDDDDPSPAGSNAKIDFHGRRRTNETHRSTTDPDARLMRETAGKEAKLCYACHALVENRNGLIVECELTMASGSTEREAGLRLLARQRRRRRRLSVGADKSYDTRDLVAGARALGITPSSKGATGRPLAKPNTGGYPFS